MEVTILMASVAVTIAIVWTIIGCVTCKKQSTDEEAHRKHFEKFRKRHMLHADRVLPSKAQLNPETITNCTLASTTTADEHTYEDMSTFHTVKTPDVPESREHSFFDESFPTVVKASSDGNIRNVGRHENTDGSQCLSVPSNKGSYLSLRPDISRVRLYTTTSVDTVDKPPDSLGKINIAYSGMSFYEGTGDCETTSTQDETYLVPINGPKITVTQPNTSEDCPQQTTQQRSHKHQHTTETNTQRFKFDHETMKISDYMNKFESKIQNDEMRYNNLKKLLMEGPSHYNEIRRQSYDSFQTMYDSINHHRLEDKTHKRTTSLVLPSQSCRYSNRTDHTYESITTELSAAMLRSDMNDSSTILDIPSTPVLACNSPPHAYSNYVSVGSETDLSTTPDHTYESIMSRRQLGSTPDLPVVIIGKNSNGSYDSFRNGNNNDHKNAFNIAEQKHCCSDTIDRYSPFPSSKKLALKSTFRPIASPGHPIIETLSGRFTPFRVPKCLDDLAQPSRRFSIENIEAYTPEIIVKDECKMFNSPQKQYFHPRTPRNSADTADDFISPLCTYETLKQCTNMRSRTQIRAQAFTPHHLPSISDSLDQEILTHCNSNENSSSTPMFVI